MKRRFDGTFFISTSKKKEFMLIGGKFGIPGLVRILGHLKMLKLILALNFSLSELLGNGK